MLFLVLELPKSRIDTSLPRSILSLCLWESLFRFFLCISSGATSQRLQSAGRFALLMNVYSADSEGSAGAVMRRHVFELKMNSENMIESSCSSNNSSSSSSSSSSSCSSSSSSSCSNSSSCKSCSSSSSSCSSSSCSSCKSCSSSSSSSCSSSNSSSTSSNCSCSRYMPTFILRLGGS